MSSASAKECLRCQVLKPLESYQKDKRGRRNVCKQCRRESEALLKNLRQEWFSNNPGKFPTHCDCCGKIAKRLVLDHCHESQKMRGWLCDQCNIAIGNLGDSLEGVLKAASYLRAKK